MNNFEKYCIGDGKPVQLHEFSTEAPTAKPDKDEVEKMLQADTEQISDLQYKLYAEDKRSLLIVLQGMDGSGKDSAIKHIMTGVNPQGVDVTSFKQPSEEELQHDFLWRHYRKLPAKGKIGIFNRSYYENVLITRVHPEIVLNERLPNINSVADIDEAFWQSRYHQINQFEQIQLKNGTTILKFFLHLSKKEQRKRFLKRLEEREKNWKFSAADIKERAFWNDYQAAYAAMLSNTSNETAPWYIIPADNKWFAHLLMGRVILRTLDSMKLQLPTVSAAEEKLIDSAKAALESKDEK